ncbi:hypothetical protein ACJJTC_009202 [Scirpophaga incertulas]
MNEKPLLKSRKKLHPDFTNHETLILESDNVSLGRGLDNAIVIPFIAISRHHCTFKKRDNMWMIEDNSSFGILINGIKLGKGVTRILSHEDIITLESSGEFIYVFLNPLHDCNIPRKRIKLEREAYDDIYNNVKLKFEESQSIERIHIEEKIQNTKHLQETTKIMKDKLESDLNTKIKQLEENFTKQIENLKGEKNEVQKHKERLIVERDIQLKTVKKEMDVKICELMSQIQKHNETETELIQENLILKEKLLKEREEFLEELNKENCSKQDLLNKLETKMREQEEVRRKEKEEFDEILHKETELLKLAKEKELKELENLRKQREEELERELKNIKQNLEKQVQHAEEERLKAQQQLNEHMEERKKLTDEEKSKMEKLIQEREEIERKLVEAQNNAERSIQQLKNRVIERETELAAVAADRIQKQAEQSGQVISSLQEQLDKMKNDLKSMETEKNALLESIGTVDCAKESSVKENMLAEVGELMESELQCSICAELFVEPITLNCSHTFCKYCITMWKKKKKDCPICRSPIISECKSLVLESFINKMVQNLTEDMKLKREELLKAREELESEEARQLSVGTSRGSFGYDESDYNSESEYFEEGEEEELLENFDDYDSYWPFRGRRFFDDSSDTDSESDGRTNTSAHAGGAEAGATAAAIPNTTSGRANGNVTGRRRGHEPGLPGAYYGGYGRCFSCGARGHWAPGCPNR